MDDEGNLTPDDFDLIDDLKLMGYGESDSSGAWIKLQVLPEHLEIFRGLRGELYEVTMRLMGNDGKPVKAIVPNTYGGEASALYRSGFFYTTEIVQHIGTDDEYQDFCRAKPCIICGDRGDVVQEGLEHAGEQRNIYAHITRAGRKPSGKKGDGSNKPIFSGVSMCVKDHDCQHKHGDLYLFNKYCDISGKREKTTNEAIAKHWMEERAGRMLAEWAHTKFANDFGYSSLSMVPPKKIVEWARSHGVQFCLPKEFNEPEKQ